LNEEAQLRRAETVSFQVVGDQAILLDLNAGRYFKLNEVGTVFWLQLDGKRTMASHAQDIAQRYGVPLELVLNDLTSLAQDLLDNRIAEVHEA
jgi:hypothetical protein